jgi:hypothetical protein
MGTLHCKVGHLIAYLVVIIRPFIVQLDILTGHSSRRERQGVCLMQGTTGQA